MNIKNIKFLTALGQFYMTNTPMISLSFGAPYVADAAKYDNDCIIDSDLLDKALEIIRGTPYEIYTMDIVGFGSNQIEVHMAAPLTEVVLQSNVSHKLTDNGRWIYSTWIDSDNVKYIVLTKREGL